MAGTAPTPASPPRRRLRRWSLRALLALALLALGLYWLLTSSFLTRRLLLAKLQDAAGQSALVTASSVTVTPLGRVQITNLSLRSKDIAGPAGEILRIDELYGHVGLWDTLRGTPVLHSLSLVRPTARISRNMDDGRVNVAALLDTPKAKPATSSGPTIRLAKIPVIAVSDATIEVGEHAAARYDTLKQFRLSGTVEQSADDSGASIISFRQGALRDGAAPAAASSSVIAGPGLSALGRLSKDSLSLTITGVDLGAISPDNVPSSVRDLVRDANIDGRVPKADITYSFAGDWTATVTLADVALTLPLEALPDEDPDGNPIPVPVHEQGTRLRLQRTSGDIILSNVGVRGTLDGQIENLPYRVDFRVDGTTTSAPWTISLAAANVPIHEQPEILKFAPGVARRRLREFSDPQGRVDAKVDIARAGATPAQPNPPLRVVGSIELKGLTAAFHKFPYPWENLSGTVTFDDSAIRIHEVKGTAPSGATVTASGTIAPPNDDAEVKLDVRAFNLPVDERLRSAMEQRGQGQVLDELFSLKDYDRLLAANLIQPPPAPTEHAAPASVPAGPPVFEMGGRLNVRVLITRAFGPGSEWFDRVEIDLPRVGALLAAFPYPLIASNVRIVQENGLAQVSGGVYEGIHGGQAGLTATLDVGNLTPGADFIPTLTASAKDIPLSPLLLAALPDVGDDANPTPLRTYLAPLGQQGLASATIDLRPNTLTTALTSALFDIRAQITGMLTPPPADGADASRLSLDEFAAAVQVTDRFVKLDAKGQLRATAANTPPQAVAINLFREIGPDAAFASTKASANQSLRVRVPRLDLALPLQDFIHQYSPDAVDALAQARPLLAAPGAAALDLRIGLSDTDAGAVDLDLTNFRDTILTTEGLNLALDPSMPQLLRVRADDQGVVANYLFNGTVPSMPTGRVRVEGTLLQPQDIRASNSSNAPNTADASTPARVEAYTIRARDITLEDPALRALLARTGAQRIAETLEQYDVTGVIDADLTIDELTPRAASDTQAPPPQPQARLSGTLRPTALAWTAHDAAGTGVRVDFPLVTGQIRLTPQAPVQSALSTDPPTSPSSTSAAPPPLAGQIESLALFHRDWKALISGGWTPVLATSTAPPGLAVDAQLTLSAPALVPSLEALLPQALAGAMAELSTRIDGPIALAQAPVSFLMTPEGDSVNINAQGTLALAGLAMDLGVAITDGEGLLDYRYTSEATPASGRASVTGVLPSVRASNVLLSDARIKLFTEPDGRVIVPAFEAQAHGGRVTGTIDIAATGAPAALRTVTPPRRIFDLSVALSGVRFAPLLDQLRTRPGARAAAAPLPASPFTPGVPTSLDESRGALSGSFTLRGVLNNRTTQRGRGTLTIEGGNILDLPTVVPLVRVTNLQLPTSEQLDYAATDFFVQGEQVGLEQLTISSQSVAIFGFGTATWPALDLDLKLRTGNRSRIPLLTTVVEQLRDELSAIRVTGPIDNPQVQTVQFGSTRAAFADLLGQEKTPEERRLDTMERSLTSSERRQRSDELPAVQPTQNQPADAQRPK